MATESQRRASAKYDTANTISVRLKININTEMDIIERLEEVGNKNGYIKQLIRDDIQKNASNKENSKKV
jgi:hypothetical protein